MGISPWAVDEALTALGHAGTVSVLAHHLLTGNYILLEQTEALIAVISR